MQNALDVLKEAGKRGLVFFLEEGKLKYKKSRRMDTDEVFIAEVARHKEDILRLLQEREAGVGVDWAAIVKERQQMERVPLSFNQERLWFIDRLDGSRHYHMPWAVGLKDMPDEAALERSFRAVIHRHEVLRTVLLEEEGKGYQAVRDSEGWRMDRLKGAGQLEAWMDRPFDLSGDYMLRAALVDSGGGYTLAVVVHHIASDGWSWPILLQELSALYRGDHPEPLKVQYADYALWQRKYLPAQQMEADLTYWKGQLKGLEPLRLLGDRGDTGSEEKTGSAVQGLVGSEDADRLRELSKKEGVTLFMLLLSVWKVLLYRYTGQQDICVGTPVSGRTMEETQGMIGFFVHTLPLRTHVEGEESFVQLLSRVRNTVLEGFEHQQAPFEKEVGGQGSLFEVLFMLQPKEGVGAFSLGETETRNIALGEGRLKYDLTMMVWEEEAGGLGLRIPYNTRIYGKEEMERMVGHYGELLHSVSREPEGLVGQLRMLQAAEERILLEDFNGGGEGYKETRTVVELFREQVLERGSSPAVVCGSAEVSYEELDERSEMLSRCLAGEALVGICMERSVEMLVGLLGVLKAGGAYVPLDPEYPQERLQYMLEDTAAGVVLVDDAGRKVLEGWYSGRMLEVGAVRETAVPATNDPVEHKAATANDLVSLNDLVSASDLAYVIYTSGSTGRPKGVMIEHGGIVSLVKDESVMPLGPDDILLSTASPSFDVAPFEFWAMLLNGGLLVLCDHDTLLDASLLKEEIRRRKVNKMWFTTSWFNQLLDRDPDLFKGLDTIIVGGEKLSGPHIYRLRKAYPELIVLNGYGPTENSTYSTTFSVGSAFQGGEVPVGRPLKHRTAYILDDRQQLLPIGVTGEIYVGGAGLARGYWHKPELTDQRFMQVHLNQEVSARVYKTGDRGRWLPDGNIEYLGRLDGQVKIRGHRIEAGEIEAAIQGSGLVRQTIVTVRQGKDAQPRLVGYVVPEGRFDVQVLRDHLRQCLPDYMIPVQWVEMTAFPLTGNGKTDMRRLPDPVDDGYIQEGYLAPGSDLEIRLAATWEELLGVTPIGLSDNFFSLGGHSLLLFPLADRLRRLGYPLAFKTLLAHPTIAQLAAHLEKQEKKIAGTGHEGIRIMQGSKEAPPLFLLPGSPGFTEPYETLVGDLGERFCIYGVALNEVPLSLDITAAVDLVLEQIRQAQPNGPYRFIGHSFGADLAFELTQRLEDSGASVDFIVLLDASARKPDLLEPGDGNLVDSRLSNLLHSLLANHQCFLPPDWAETWMRDTREMTKEDRLSFLVYHIAAATGLRDKRLLRALHGRLVHSSMPYQAVGSIKAPLIVVRAEEENWSGYGEFLGWQDHAGDVQAISAPGNHSSLVDQANGPLLAKRLAELIQAINIKS